MANEYKLLTPGPLTTTRTVKEEMLFDHCTWDEDYQQITQKIRRQLLELAHCDPADYTAVLMQGSGTFGVESVLTSVIGKDEKVLLCTNGAYGDRQVKICEHAGIDYVQYAEPYDRIPDAGKVEDYLRNDPSITHVSMIHSETTSGLLNDIAAVATVAKAHGCTFMVDAMSSFGGVDIPVAGWGIDFLVSSANKCIQGVPGFSFIICNKRPRARRAASRSTCGTSGTRSRRPTASGATPRRPTWCSRSPRRWTKCSPRAAFRRVPAATRSTTACSSRA
ncbi:aminotransferase class V-fold PLP-dependent enzyme [Bifidobacterium sp. 82T10]|uniref:Aminotransferase class V-fold PLP-dependent enzyme n=1 Tax=Bifidobacterium miconis TaxID=2834435 RepID=A0ABS6WDA5_9BIFI|nr:aminotransferase class V-fold PLP-dependent enzyme [Bifidobacterium miconis]MBW3092036.1 aminotransferase class V-fold PLP-dependent enzyme [Bifidobacterium miconis]